MKIVRKPTTVEEIIKKSRFIGFISPCHSEKEAHSLLQQLHLQHPHANHIVFSYRINSEKGLVSRFYDAGEPSGTAGKPVFKHLEGKQLINVIIVVIRYFGGIKLGAGGLTRAYSNTAKKVIAVSKISDYIEYTQIQLELEYKQMQTLEYHLKKLEGMILSQNFSEKIKVIIKIPSENVSTLKALLN